MNLRHHKLRLVSALPFLFAVIGCTQANRMYAIAPAPALVAVQEIALPSTAQMDIHAGSIVAGHQAGCADNPPIYVIVGDGVSESAIQGDYVLRSAENVDSSVIITALVDPNTLGARTTGATDALMILDTMSLQAGSWRSQSSEAQKIFLVTQRNGSVRLASKPIEFSVCNAVGRNPSEKALELVTSKSGRDSVWVTQLALDPASAMALQTLADPNVSASARQEALGALASIEHAEGTAVAVAAAPSSVPADWTSKYTARSGAWDRCARLPTDRQNVRCSAGAHFSLVGLAPSAIRIFGPDTGRYVRLRLNSNPTDASIFSGAIRQPGRTNTSMDILAEELPKLRLEKSGFQPCPYGPRWVIEQIGAGRKTLQATCSLVPLAARKH